MQIPVTKITIILSDTADKVLLSTNLPGTMPAVCDGSLYFSFSVARDGAEKFVQRVLLPLAPGEQIPVFVKDFRWPPEERRK